MFKRTTNPIAIGFVVLLNTIDKKSFRVKDLNRKKYFKLSQGSDDIGVNAMSLSDITGIPRNSCYIR